MAISVIPTPVVSTSDTWTLIATNTPTSGTTSTFSSLSGYKKYLLVGEAVTGTNGALRVTFNGSATNYISVIHNIAAETTFLIFTLNNTNVSGYMSIENVNNNGPKVTSGTDGNGYTPVSGIWNNTDPITSITVTRTTAYTGGTLKLYGVAA